MQCELCKDFLTLQTVKKEGSNKNRQFYAHSKTSHCKKFYWNDDKTYNSSRFKRGACYRCGYFGCESIECNKKFDWFGNLIPI